MLTAKDISNILERATIGKQIYKTPRTPNFKIQLSTKDMEVVDTDQQKKYRCAVGMLLYFTKYSPPDISNMLREISKCMSGATWDAYHEMLRVIKIVIDTKILD
jgi:hypothetical protein